MMFPNARKVSSEKGGFSAVELIVVVAIIVTITTVVLFGHVQFQNSTGLQIAAHELSLSVREAQVFGIAIKENAPDVYPSYGVYFEAATPEEAIFYADTNGTAGYQAGDTIINRYKLKRPFVITEYCTNDTGLDPIAVPSRLKCTVDGVTYVDALFQRPSPEPVVKSDLSPVGGSGYGRIDIENPDGGKFQLFIWSTGQVSLDQDPSVEVYYGN